MAGRIEKLERLKEILGLFALPIPYESFKEDRSLNVEQCVTELLAKNLISKGDVSYLLHVEKMTDEQLWNFFCKNTIWNGFVNIEEGYGITEPPWNISGTLPPPNRARILAMMRQLANAIIYELERLDS
jgi:hypothetical protein